MKAVRLERVAPAEEGPLRALELADPEAGAGEVLIAVEACGVCRTDLHILEGEVQARLPVVLGHQAAGRVVASGAGVTSLTPGDHVGVGWLAWTCGQCRFCLASRENLCERATFTGRDRDGGYAGKMTARAEWVYRLPAGFSSREAAPLLCAGIIGYRSLRQSGIEPGGRLGLFGFGASALLAIQVALHRGCEVYVFTREAHRRELARQMGARWAGAADEDPGVRLDAAVTFAPAGEIVPVALSRLESGGTLAINAIYMSAIPSLDYATLYGERTVRSVMNYTRRDAEEFLALAAQIPIRATAVFFPLEEANEALLRVKRGQVHGAAVLVP
ncbi:MAG TPA: zinc-dependent alcohol dehydrogenase family protein [Thermoanaerobaculia bacterium]|nr:zinc-dependent alcohol dehydrogenase family protein [Thermoanaerobaculia bacterium]